MGKISNAKATVSDKVREARIGAEVKYLGRKEARKIRKGVKQELGIKSYLDKHNIKP